MGSGRCACCMIWALAHCCNLHLYDFIIIMRLLIGLLCIQVTNLLWVPICVPHIPHSHFSSNRSNFNSDKAPYTSLVPRPSPKRGSGNETSIIIQEHVSSDHIPRDSVSAGLRS